MTTWLAYVTKKLTTLKVSFSSTTKLYTIGKSFLSIKLMPGTQLSESQFSQQKKTDYSVTAFLE